MGWIVWLVKWVALFGLVELVEWFKVWNGWHSWNGWIGKISLFFEEIDIMNFFENSKNFFAYNTGYHAIILLNWKPGHQGPPSELNPN